MCIVEWFAKSIQTFVANEFKQLGIIPTYYLDLYQFNLLDLELCEGFFLAGREYLIFIVMKFVPSTYLLQVFKKLIF